MTEERGGRWVGDGDLPEGAAVWGLHSPRIGTALADRETVGKREETRWHLETLKFLARGISPQASR